MMAFIHNVISSLLKVERRRYKRIPCNIKAHFFISSNARQHRGNATITDITLHGLCCDELHFFHENKELKLKRNSKINIYFTLPKEDGSSHNFELVGRIKSFIVKDSHGYTQRIGIEIQSMRSKDKKIFRQCIAFLDKSSKTHS